MGGRSGVEGGSGVEERMDGQTNKKAPTPIIHAPYLDIGDDLEFERG